MHGPFELLLSVTIILMVAGVIGALLSLFRMPGVLAFIITGILIGPGGLRLVSNTEIITTFAQLGIIFLLFVLGAELSLPRLKEMRIHSLQAGVLQLVLTNVILACGFGLFGLDFKASVFIGGALALSSTAIVMKMLEEQGEIETAHGRITMGILIVQDLALVPFMAFMPLLTGSGGHEEMLYSLAWVLFKTVVVLGSIMLLSWKFAPRVIDKIAAVSSKEIFSLWVLGFGMLIALIAERLGLSYAVGAFAAGLCLSRSVTSRQIIAESLPFRDIFSTVFFVSVGMLMNTSFVVTHFPQTLGVTILICLVKFLTISLSVYLLRFPLKNHALVRAVAVSGGGILVYLVADGPA